MRTRPEHPWTRLPQWQKRLHGFFCYQMSAFVALLFPVEADKAMYATLREQFAGDSDDYEDGYHHGLSDGLDDRHGQTPNKAQRPAGRLVSRREER